MSESLLPCPFCSKSVGELTHARELADDPDDYPHSDNWAVICNNARPNGRFGCGASGGFFPSEEAAIAAWNRRTPAPQPIPQGAAEERDCETCEGLGTIDMTLGGESFSDPKAECPDCDGKGWWVPSATPAATVAAVPADVLAALDRMCTPLHESWLQGATAEADAKCMKLIRDYIMGAAPVAAPVVAAEPADSATLRDLEPLRGKNLACWCRLTDECHADVLLELANGAPSKGGET